METTTKNEHTYSVEMQDSESDFYTDDFSTLQEMKEHITKQKAKGFKLIRTWHDINGEYVGSAI